MNNNRNQYSHTLLDYLKNSDKISFNAFKMRMDLMGFSPDVDFVYALLRLSFNEYYSMNRNCPITTVFIECIKHNIFIDEIKSDIIFDELIKNIKTKVAYSILYAISKKRPGILIKKFFDAIKNKNNILISSNHIETSCFDTFANLTFKISSEIAKQNENYANSTHLKVKQIIQDMYVCGSLWH
jgi:hypothetical protein